ncbi:MAG: HDOD domain-containing protein [Puniceicoccaceae bacterium]
MDDNWIRKVPFLRHIVAIFGGGQKASEVPARAKSAETVAPAHLPAVESPPEPPPERSFSAEAKWRYNLGAMQDMLKERLPEKDTLFPGQTGQAIDYDSFEPVDPQEVRERISELNHIPVLKTVSQSFQLASRSTNADLKELSEIVRRDPGLNTKILRMINSSFFQIESKVTDIEHAMILLGLDRIRFMAQTLGTVNELNRCSTGFDLRHLWSHSFSCGLLAEHLAQQLDLPDLVHAYSAGLMHDVGKIILSSTYPEEYRKILKMGYAKGFNLNAAERRVFGCDHEEAGGLFAEVQKLPPAITQAMRYHGNPKDAPEEERDTAAILFLANHYAKEYHLGFSGSSKQATKGELTSTVRCLSSRLLDHCPEDEVNIRMSLLEESVYGAIPGVQQEVDELLLVTFGRSLPSNAHSPIPFKI